MHEDSQRPITRFCVASFLLSQPKAFAGRWTTARRKVWNLNNILTPAVRLLRELRLVNPGMIEKVRAFVQLELERSTKSREILRRELSVAWSDLVGRFSLAIEFRLISFVRYRGLKANDFCAKQTGAHFLCSHFC